MIIKRAGPLVCYLLHFEQPVGRAQHYLGSTFEHILPRRLQAHAAGRGSRLTAYAMQGSGRVALANVWPIFTRQDEMRHKRNGHLKRLCPICDGRLALQDAPTLSPTAPLLNAWNGLQWPGSLAHGPGVSKP